MFQVSVYHTLAGQYHWNVKVANQHIDGSPFDVTIVATDTDAARSFFTTYG